MAKSEKSNFFISNARDKPSSRINVLPNTFNSARQIVTTFRHRGCGSVVRKWWRLSGMHHREAMFPRRLTVRIVNAYATERYG